MAAHPTRPSWQPMPSAGNTGGGTSHPARPFGSAGGNINQTSIGHGRMGQKTPLPSMPTRSGNLSRPFGTNET